MMLDHPGFFERAGPFRIAELAERLGARLGEGVAESAKATEIASVAPLDQAGPGEVSFLDNAKYKPQLATTRASACLVHPSMAAAVPDGIVPLEMDRPYHGFARALALIYPTASKPPVLAHTSDAIVDPTAEIEDGAIIEPGAMIGAQAQIGRGTRVCAGAVVGYRVTVGRDCLIGSNTVTICTLIGDRVILHAGVRLGQDGFGFAMGPDGHLKVPQVGRVIIQDDVEIGAGTTIDRGALKDTVIGEGTKIDNLVQIGHNVRIGRHCVIVAQVGISGSTEIGDFVVMGGQSGAVGHIKIGMGAQIAGASHVKNDVAPGERVGGTPAKPLRQWARELSAIKRLAGKR
jgi:UDP-3-O-[3-hydroxymyristoyl] glucosamine N-acyltransferase